MTQQEVQTFNKVRLGGMEADLEGYAYQIELNEGKPKAILWYLSMVGHKTAVQAIWAGLVNTPPQSIVLYREEDFSEDESSELAGQVENGEERKPKAIMLQLAEGWHSGGWNFLKTQLNVSYAYQGVLLPKTALLNSTQERSNPKRRKASSTSSSADEKEVQTQFLLLKPPPLPIRNSTSVPISDSRNSADSDLQFQQLYFARLNALTSLPLHPGWSEALWQRAASNGETERLECAGIDIYLCRKPAEEVLRQEIADLVHLGKLSC